MPGIKSVNNSKKYTVVIPADDLDQLKELADRKIIASVNAGVREAVEDYIVKLKKEMYKKDLMEAVEDEAFIKRSTESEQDFELLDQEAEEMTPEW
ncbi:MAG: hypothetical protein GX248_00350 [Peptococcaceae bacterium]|jgi:uncharacterized radical SAM superfamily protein|nr:hypothetical protein [Peptococcaceae bacterium]